MTLGGHFPANWYKGHICVVYDNTVTELHCCRDVKNYINSQLYCETYKDNSLLLSNSCKTRRNTAKDEQKYQTIFLLVFSGSRVTKSQVY